MHKWELEADWGRADRREDSITIKALTKHMHVHCTIAHHVTLPFSILLPYAPLLRTAHHEDSLSNEYTDYKHRQPPTENFAGKKIRHSFSMIQVPTWPRPSDSTLGRLPREMQSRGTWTLCPSSTHFHNAQIHTWHLQIHESDQDLPYHVTEGRNSAHAGPWRQ